MSRAPVDVPNPSTEERDEDEEMPRVVITRRGALLFGVFVAVALAFLYFVLPKLTGLSGDWKRIKDGDPWWLAIALVLEGVSFLGYVWLFRAVFVRGEQSRIDWRASYEITMAGLAATRLFATAGAGGVALTAWALRRSGMERRTVACRMIAFLVLLYAVYMASVVVVGIGLRVGLLRGGGSLAITIVPATFAAVLMVLFLGMAALPEDAERRLQRWASGSGRAARFVAKAVTVPASAASGVRTAIGLVRARNPGVLGAVVWWYFDIFTLWACFHAFGPDPPPFAIIVLGYFVGMLGNTLPLPGGIGGVDGGMIGAFAAFDVSVGYATLAVLSYRAFAFWLPTLPGAIAYFQLRRTVGRWREDRDTERALARAATARA